MMRGATVALPPIAAEKLSELTLARDLALDASRSSNARLQQLPLDADPRMRERLAAEQAKHQQRFSVLSRVVSAINQWAVELRLPAGHVLEPAYVRIELKPKETLAEAIGNVRAEIAGLKGQITVVRSAPLKKSSQQDAIAAHLDHLARQSRPKIGFDARGNATVRWVEDLATMDGVLGLLVLVLTPQVVASAFQRDLEQEPEPADSLTPAERDQRLGELSVQLLERERIEEALKDTFF
jgi:hypothetical protein